MKITKNQLRRIIREERARLIAEQAPGMAPGLETDDLESKAKIIRGLEMAGIDSGKLDQLPSNQKQLAALLDMINQAIDTTVAGKGIQAQRRTSRVTQGLE